VTTSLTYVPSASGNHNLALILVYITYFSDFAGRQATIIPFRLVRNQVAELIAACIRFLWVPGILLYIKVPGWQNDWVAYVFIAINSIIGGYVRTLVFTIGPRAVALENRPKVSLILNLGITVGVYSGIIFSFIAGTWIM